MTGIELILFLAVVGLAAQVLILQGHYSEKLSDQAAVLEFLLETVTENREDEEKIDQLRTKIFNSSL
ncbi:MAG: hypothetical protein P4N59_26245 [Negativicutes bacterium]|nr:hypothetical protein [Negativicutes bacterium]